ncbi:hypothetical protein DPMN_165435 [Dreissena polymorpha]|uniref:Uncharacterized protein n=1 Tax=Dreissena polymorpha TaxID=45954 RepID=A0A9D4EUU2_DREPO|nr:hypothetical protein DPMN_165435 [Dreissena polymorpha]
MAIGEIGGEPPDCVTMETNSLRYTTWRQKRDIYVLYAPEDISTDAIWYIMKITRWDVTL